MGIGPIDIQDLARGMSLVGRVFERTSGGPAAFLAASAFRSEVNDTAD